MVMQHKACCLICQAWICQDFELYKLLLGEKALTEQLIASKNSTTTDFNKKWQPLISSKHSLIRLHFYHPFSYFYYFHFLNLLPIYSFIIIVSIIFKSH